MNYIAELLQFLVLIPSSILCFFPMKNQLKISIGKLFQNGCLIFLCTIPTAAFLTAYFDIPVNVIMIPVVVFLFFWYHSLLKSSLCANLAIYLLTMALVSFPANLSLVIDSQVHPVEKSSAHCVIATGSQLGITFLFLLLFAHFFIHSLGQLIDSQISSKVWCASLPIPFLFLLLNVMMQPQEYQTMHINNVFIIYVFYLIVALVLLTIIYILFYMVAIELLRSARNAERVRLLEMQESQYLSQQRYMAESARMRHDFRQQLCTLAEMAKRREYDALTEHLTACVSSLPESVTTYCMNVPVNALLNHYASLLEEAQVHRNWRISLPTALPISDTELCGLLGNILENVYHGCITLPPAERYHDFTICVKHEKSLYFVSSNSFNGVVKQRDGIYKSTHKGGSGIGLSSIAITAEEYDGMASFSHLDKEFHIDVVLQI